MLKERFQIKNVKSPWKKDKEQILTLLYILMKREINH